jgi:hypothetical protein
MHEVRTQPSNEDCAILHGRFTHAQERPCHRISS